MAKKSSFNRSSPLLYIVLGALLVIFKLQALDWAMTLAGAFFVVMGVIDILKKNPSSGVVNLIIGIVILLLGWTILDLVLIVLGVMIAIKGALELVAALKHSRKNIWAVVFPIITMVLGVALAFGNALGDLIMVVGVLLIVDGILGLVGSRR